MKAKVTEKGVVIPKEFLEGIEEVEIRKADGLVVIVPTTKSDPILALGRIPWSAAPLMPSSAMTNICTVQTEELRGLCSLSLA